MDGGFSGELLPTTDGGIHVVRVEFDRASQAASLLCRQQRGAAAAEGIEHKAAAGRTVLQGIDNERQRLDGRMHAKLVHATRLEGVDTRIIPDVGSVTAALAQAE